MPKVIIGQKEVERILETIEKGWRLNSGQGKQLIGAGHSIWIVVIDDKLVDCGECGSVGEGLSCAKKSFKKFC
jgi:hypothetical protein